MSHFASRLFSSLVLLGTAVAFAGPIPYSNTGHAASLMNITASSSGPIMGYFVDSSAGDSDSIAMLDITTGVMSSYFFSNHSTSTGATANFGTVAAGDHLVFVMNNSTQNDLLRSDAVNADGITHAYLTTYAGGMLDGSSFPAGVYVGFEDRLSSQGSDLDYNDDNFIFTNVAAQTVTPEPGSLALMGTGAMGALGMLRRRLARR